MAAFMLPALALPLADPLMSLVDTVCIGQFAGTQELASLGPANIIFGFAQYIFTSLQVATVGLITDQLRKDNTKEASALLSSAISLALACGAASTLLMEAFAEQMILMTGADATLVPLATTYLKLRAIGQPAVLLLRVAQSGLLAQRDSVTPLLTTIISTLVSLAGNVVFVAYLGWGLTGAAMTTVVTQYVGAAALIWALNHVGEVSGMALLGYRYIQPCASQQAALGVC